MKALKYFLVILSIIFSSIAYAEWVNFEVSGYTLDPNECSPHLITASGVKPMIGRTIAVDARYIPFGTKIYIQDLGIRIAEDTGSLIEEYSIDLLVATKEQAYRLGRRKIWCYIFR